MPNSDMVYVFIVITYIEELTRVVILYEIY